MDNICVSVVVPVYNVEKYLDRCISSIVNQTYRNLEIILVDDGSQDSSPGMCDAWAEKDSRIKVIHKKNEGAGFARNSGMEIASGDYLCFFDSDDCIAPDTVEKACCLAQKEKPDIVIFGAAVVDQQGNVIGKRIPTSQQYSYHGDAVRTVVLPDLIDGNHNKSLINNLSLSLWSCIFSMELIRRSKWKLVSEREYVSEDSYSLMALYSQINSVVLLPETLYSYYMTTGSLSHSYKEDMHQRLKVFYGKCIELANELNYSDEVRCRIAGLFLSQEIGAMKQVLLADMKSSEKYIRIREIVTDEMMQRALADIHWKYHSQAKNMLVWAMRRRWNSAIYLMVKAQLMKESWGKRFAKKG